MSISKFSPTRNIIIAPVGSDISYHKVWRSGRRNFDLMLINYSDVPFKYADDADYYYQAKGFKLEILKEAITFYKEIVKQYSAVWLPDGDLYITSTKLTYLNLQPIFLRVASKLAYPRLILG